MEYMCSKRRKRVTNWHDPDVKLLTTSIDDAIPIRTAVFEFLRTFRQSNEELSNIGRLKEERLHNFFRDMDAGKNMRDK